MVVNCDQVMDTVSVCVCLDEKQGHKIVVDSRSLERSQLQVISSSDLLLADG